MSIAQELYEGIELGEYGLTGLITYMRTDSLRLADEATAAAAGFIKGRYGEDYYPGKPRAYKTKSGAQDAHEAIRPSNVQLLPEEIRKYLSPDQFKLYRLIWSRFVACQMADAILDTVSADIVCEGQVFRASGHTVAFPGFTAVYEEGTDDEKKQDAAGKPLPRFDKGDRLTAEKARAVAALYAAARALYRGVAHPCDGGARHRPSVHLCADHLDHHRPRLRHQGEPRAASDAARRGRYRSARGRVQVGRGLRVYREHGARGSTRSRPAG